MTDDLLKRLREMRGPNVWEAADRIEELEKNFELQLEWYLSNKRRLDDRIEKLEAALQKIADIEQEDLPKPAGAAEGTLWVILAGCVEVAEKALEGKDD